MSEVSETGIHPPSYWPIPLDVTYIHNSNGNAWAAMGGNIQEAIDDLPALTGSYPSPHTGWVQLPYASIDDPIILPSTLTIHGFLAIHGLGLGLTYIELDDDVNKSMIKWASADTQYHFELHNLTLLGNRDNQTAGHGIEIDDSLGGSLRDIRIKNVGIITCKQDGINTDCAWGHIYEGLGIERCYGNGVSILAGTTGLRMIGCKTNENGTGGTGHGIQLQGTGHDLMGGFSSINREQGIHIAGNYNRVRGYTIRGNSQRGANTRDGIRVTTSHNIIADNFVQGNENGSDMHKYGINVSAAGATDNKLDNNTIINSATSPYNDSGKRTTINGIGNNGTNDPASAGDWNGNGREGVLVKWDAAGPTHHMSVYRNGAWYDWTVT